MGNMETVIFPHGSEFLPYEAIFFTHRIKLQEYIFITTFSTTLVPAGTNFYRDNQSLAPCQSGRGHK